MLIWPWVDLRSGLGSFAIGSVAIGELTRVEKSVVVFLAKSTAEI